MSTSENSAKADTTKDPRTLAELSRGGAEEVHSLVKGIMSKKNPTEEETQAFIDFLSISGDEVKGKMLPALNDLFDRGILNRKRPHWIFVKIFLSAVNDTPTEGYSDYVLGRMVWENVLLYISEEIANLNSKDTYMQSVQSKREIDIEYMKELLAQVEKMEALKTLERVEQVIRNLLSSPK